MKRVLQGCWTQNLRSVNSISVNRLNTPFKIEQVKKKGKAKYLEINLVKDLLDIYEEKHKTLLKDLKSV